jgi:hypothetical protein
MTVYYMSFIQQNISLLYWLAPYVTRKRVVVVVRKAKKVCSYTVLC